MKIRMILALALALTLCVTALASDSAVISMRNQDGTISRNVQVKRLGSVLTVIAGSGGERVIPSSWLIWDRTAPLDRHFAYIYYTKKTTVNLRLTERPKSAILLKASVGRIVMVSEIGESYSKVIYGDTAGWLPNSVLRFLGPTEDTPLNAVVSYEGSTTSTRKVNLRQDASKASKALVGLRPGMSAVVRGQKNDWYEVDVDGWHGWVQAAFLTLGGPVDLGTVSEAPEEDGPADEPAEPDEPVQPEAPEEPDETGVDLTNDLTGVDETVWEEPTGDEDEDTEREPTPVHEPLSDDLFEPIG